MARGFGARESITAFGSGWGNRPSPGTQADAFSDAVGGLSSDAKQKLSESIFFKSGSDARSAAIAGYKGPASKNSFSWFKPDVEMEIATAAQKWASQPKIKEALGKMWDDAKPKDFEPNIKDTPLRNSYEDRQTFIDRYVRFLADDFKNAFYTPIARALDWNPSNKERVNGDEGIRLTGDADWNKLATEETAKIRQQALDWMKDRVSSQSNLG